MKNKYLFLIYLVLIIILLSQSVNAMTVFLDCNYKKMCSVLTWGEAHTLQEDFSFDINFLLGVNYFGDFSKYFNQFNFTIDPSESVSSYNITNIFVVGCFKPEDNFNYGFNPGGISFPCERSFRPNVTLISHNNYTRSNTFLVSTEINQSQQYEEYYFIITYTIPNMPLNRGDYRYVISAQSNLQGNTEDLRIHKEIFLNSTDFIPMDIPSGTGINSYTSTQDYRSLRWGIASDKLGFLQFTFSKSSEITKNVPRYWAIYSALIGAVVGALATFLLPFNIKNLINMLKEKSSEDNDIHKYSQRDLQRARDFVSEFLLSLGIATLIGGMLVFDINTTHHWILLILGITSIASSSYIRFSKISIEKLQKYDFLTYLPSAMFLVYSIIFFIIMQYKGGIAFLSVSIILYILSRLAKKSN